MKKILLSLLICLFCTIANAQFKLSINGFVDSNDVSKDYIVYEIKEKNQERLYTDVLKFINTSFKSPKDVINEVQAEMITISGFQPEKIGIGKIMGMYAGVYDLRYNITIRFKDGKIRIDAPTFECTSFSSGKTSRLVLQGSNGGFGSEVKTGLFKKNGKPAREEAIEALELFFNNFCAIMLESINNTSTEEW